MVLDDLVSGGLLKLAVSILLAEEVHLRGISDASGLCSYNILPGFLKPAVFFESIFDPSGAAMMNGPLIQTHRGGCPSDASSH